MMALRSFVTISAKVDALARQSLHEIADNILDLEDELDALERDADAKDEIIAQLRQEVTDLEAQLSAERTAA